MKKVLLILFLISFTFLLASCDQEKEAEKVNLSYDEITEKINDLLDAKSYEAQIQARVNTDEMEISFKPLLTVQKYTDENDQVMVHAKYYNKLMEGAGLDAFETYVDEANDMLYINNTQCWYQGNISQLEDMDSPVSYPTTLDEEMQGHLEAIQDIILNSIKDFTKATYVDVIDDGNRRLVHYELDYNVYNVLKAIYDYVDLNMESSGYNSFEELIQDYEIADIMNLFKTFTVDVYFDTETLTIGRIELDLMNILDNEILVDKIQEEIDEEDVNFGTMLEYINDIEIALNIDQVNTLPEITIPNEAKTGYSFDFLNAPFNPKNLHNLSIGQEATINMSENDDYWYTFTVDSQTDIEVVFDLAVYAPYVTIFDSEFSYYNSFYDTNTETRYYSLMPGTYYLHLYKGYGSNTFHLNLHN